MAKITTKTVATAAIIGIAAGYVAGVLTAPKSGKETRQDLKDATAKTYRAAERRLKTLSDELGEVIDEAKARAKSLNKRSREELDELLATARTAQSKAKALLGSLRKGEVNDEELQETLTAAKEARDDIESFLTDKE